MPGQTRRRWSSRMNTVDRAKNIRMLIEMQNGKAKTAAINKLNEARSCWQSELDFLQNVEVANTSQGNIRKLRQKTDELKQALEILE